MVSIIIISLKSVDRWTPNPVTDEVAFESIKASLDSVPTGSKMLINSGAQPSSAFFPRLQSDHTSRRILRRHPARGEPRARRPLLREIPDVPGQGLPLRQGRQQARLARGGQLVRTACLFARTSESSLSYIRSRRPENLRASVDTILEKLRGTKRLDLFQCARVDRKVPIKDAIASLAGLVKEGKFDYIGMSECKASTLREGNSVRDRHFRAVRKQEL